MLRTLLISAPATLLLLLLTAAGPALAQPTGAPTSGDASPADDLDELEEQAKQDHSRKARDRRSRKRRAHRHRHRHRHGCGHVVLRHRTARPRIVVEEEPVVVAHGNKRPRTGMTRGWRHVGGGFGTAWVPAFDAATPMGRFELGAGGYTIGLYGGGGLEVAGSSATPISATAVGYAGMAVPVPVVHPLIGVKVGAGGHLDHQGAGPHVTVGPQAGFILRPYDGDFGLRVMFDVDVVIKPTKGEVAPQAMLTFAGVF